MQLGATSVEIALVMVLMTAVIGATMFYLRSTLPSLDAQARAHTQLALGAANSARLGLSLGNSRAGSASSQDWIQDPVLIDGPRPWFSFIVPAESALLPNFSDELNGLLSVLSNSTVQTMENLDLWCVALFDPRSSYPLTDDSGKECRVGLNHIVEDGGELGPSEGCNLEEHVRCLSDASEWVLQSYGCEGDGVYGSRPLLVGIYPAGNASSSSGETCVIREVSSSWTWDIRDSVFLSGEESGGAAK